MIEHYTTTVSCFALNTPKLGGAPPLAVQLKRALPRVPRFCSGFYYVSLICIHLTKERHGILGIIGLNSLGVEFMRSASKAKIFTLWV